MNLDEARNVAQSACMQMSSPNMLQSNRDAGDLNPLPRPVYPIPLLRCVSS